jgi:hypothetical protein
MLFHFINSFKLLSSAEVTNRKKKTARAKRGTATARTPGRRYDHSPFTPTQPAFGQPFPSGLQMEKHLHCPAV